MGIQILFTSVVLVIRTACGEDLDSKYYSPGPSQLTNRRIMALVAESEAYEIGWCEVVAKSDAVGLEQRLLERYFEQHGERPPQNMKG